MLEGKTPSSIESGSDTRLKELADEANLSAPTEKWGEALDGGFQVLPDLLIRCQRELQLSATDMMVVLNLTMAWWDRGRLPFPRPSTIARRMDVTDRTVQRSIERLKKKRLLYKKTQTQAGETRVAFDLSPLAERLKDISRTDPVSERRREIRTEKAGDQTQSLAQAQLV